MCTTIFSWPFSHAARSSYPHQVSSSIFKMLLNLAKVSQLLYFSLRTRLTLVFICIYTPRVFCVQMMKGIPNWERVWSAFFSAFMNCWAYILFLKSCYPYFGIFSFLGVTPSLEKHHIPSETSMVMPGHLGLIWCSSCFCPPEGAGSLQWTGVSASKPSKPKGKKKFSSRQKFDVSFHHLS